MKNNEFGEYSKMLFNQFLTATGIDENKLIYGSITSGFQDWILENKKVGNLYLKLLYEIFNEEFINRYQTIEVGKGIRDSIAINTNMTIISPYMDNEFEMNNQQIYIGDVVIKNLYPYFIGKIKGENICRKFRYQVFNFIMHNPYSVNALFNWDYLYNGTDNNVILGVFGNNKDKDKNQKIKLLQDFNKLLVRKAKEEYAVIDDNYFLILNGVKNKEKVKVKSL